MKFFFLLLSLSFAVGFISCNDDFDPDCDVSEYGLEFTDRAVKLTAAENDYSDDPANDDFCKAYVNELNTQIYFYEKHQDCGEINFNGSIDASIANAKTLRDELPCY